MAPAALPPLVREHRARDLAVRLAGPALIAGSVLIALRGFAFAGHLTNQHPDLLSFWLPRSCFLGRSLAAGHVPLWNPFEMAGTPFAADPQSGWLYLPGMLSSRLFGCGGGLRALVVLNPVLAGLGLWWFLRKEGLGRIAAAAGGLSLAMMMAASNVAISLPFAGTLAWTPLVLVGASGYFSAVRLTRRVGWLALAALAWGQVASAHMSHGLVVCTGLTVAYVLSRSVRDVRSGTVSARRAVALGGAFLAFLPLANAAILVPRFALIARSSLRGGYASLGGTLARAAGIEDRPLPTNGVWSAWPLALASTPGAYAGAAILLALPMAVRDRARRHLVVAFGAVGALGYLLTLNLFVGAAWFRNLVLRLPFGDVYLHNPGRLRYLGLLIAPALGAIGLQWLLDRRPSARRALRWLAPGAALFLALPLALGAHRQRLLVFAIGCAATVAAVLLLSRRWRWAPIVLTGVLAVELLGGALWSSAYEGGTVYFGLEGDDHPALVPGPLRWPSVSLDRYLEPGPMAVEIRRQGPDDGRYLAWVPPAAYFNKGYLFTQDPGDWPALLIGRAALFRLNDALGYSPIQLPRYWSYMRATNRLPVFYNASALQVPSIEDVRLLGIRYLIAHEGQALPAGLTGAEVARERGYVLYELAGWEQRASVVPAWTVAGGVEGLRDVLRIGFDPAASAVVEADPGAAPSPGASAGSATYRETWPEDVRITAEATAPSLVVVRNAWDRGWTATVDGVPAPVLRADYFLQAVPVPAGRYEVRLTYRDAWIGRGLVGSAIAWMLLAAAATPALVRRRRSPTRRPAPPPGA